MKISKKKVQNNDWPRQSVPTATIPEQSHLSSQHQIVSSTFKEEHEQLHGKGRHTSQGNLPGTSTVIAQFLLLMHNKKMFDKENEGQSDGAQHMQWCYSMANINLYHVYKNCNTHFYAISCRFDDIKVCNV